MTPAAFTREQGIVQQHLIPAFPIRIADVRRAVIQRYILNRTGKVSADSIIKEFNTLKHIMRVAVEWELIPTNPAQGIRPPKAAAGRVRYLQPNELRAVLLQCPEWLRPIVIVAVNTGMRRSEILKLRPLDIDLNHGCILLRLTNNGESRIVYLAQILGHKDLRMAARYQHLSPAFMAEAVSRLDAVFSSERHQSVTEQKMLIEKSGASA